MALVPLSINLPKCRCARNQIQWVWYVQLSGVHLLASQQRNVVSKGLNTLHQILRPLHSPPPLHSPKHTSIANFLQNSLTPSSILPPQSPLSRTIICSKNHTFKGFKSQFHSLTIEPTRFVQMRQALRRATSRVRSSNLEPPPRATKPSSSSTSSQLNKPPPPPEVPNMEPKIVSKTQLNDPPDQDGISQSNSENVLEERDPGFDAMLSQMVGRIKSKPGGKLEMGEAFVVEKYNRPMPKLRNTKSDTSYNEERPVPAGTLNVSQLRQILLLHQGKSEDHNGSMDTQQISQRFRIDATQVQKILLFVSLPPKGSNSIEQKK